MATLRGIAVRRRLPGSCPVARCAPRTAREPRNTLSLVLAAAICAAGVAGCDSGTSSSHTPNPGVSTSMTVTGPNGLKVASESTEWGAFLCGLASQGKLVTGVYGFEFANSTGQKIRAVSLEVKRERACLNAYRGSLLVQSFPDRNK